MSRTEEFLRQGLRAMQGCAGRLDRSLRKLQPLFPLSPEQTADLSPDDQEAVDALLKRFEQLVTTMQDQVFRSLAALAGANPDLMSGRDLAELMEKHGVIPSARTFRDQVALRNRLAHVYPEDPVRQARILNEVFEAACELRTSAQQVQAYVQDRTATN